MSVTYSELVGVYITLTLPAHHSAVPDIHIMYTNIHTYTQQTLAVDHVVSGHHVYNRFTEHSFMDVSVAEWLAWLAGIASESVP